jgi:hypothetical protein
MNTTKPPAKILAIIASFAAGIAFALSCGDESPRSVDAATQCDCPASEPPLAGRLTRKTANQTIPSLRVSGIGVGCPLDGSIPLSGGCLSNSSDPKYVLNSSYPAPADNPIGWACDFYNGTASAVTSTAYVLCLKPAP